MAGGAVVDVVAVTEGLGLGEDHHGDARCTTSTMVAASLACAHWSGRAMQSEISRLRRRTEALGAGVSLRQKFQRGHKGLRKIKGRWMGGVSTSGAWSPRRNRGSTAAGSADSGDEIWWSQGTVGERKGGEIERRFRGF